jgi:hypothetical protein
MPAFLFAILYGTFAIFFVVVNLSTLDISTATEIFDMINDKFRDEPFSLGKIIIPFSIV